MRRCLRCLQTFLGSGDYCADCRRCLLRLWAEIGTDEHLVLEFSAVSSSQCQKEREQLIAEPLAGRGYKKRR